MCCGNTIRPLSYELEARANTLMALGRLGRGNAGAGSITLPRMLGTINLPNGKVMIQVTRNIVDWGLRCGWEAGIRTPISRVRVCCPTVERPPSSDLNISTPVFSCQVLTISYF